MLRRRHQALQGFCSTGAAESISGTESVLLDSNDFAIVCHTNQQCSAVRIQECGDCLQAGICHLFIILPSSNIPAKCRLEFKSGAFAGASACEHGLPVHRSGPQRYELAAHKIAPPCCVI
jgi:hypothetical protein